VTGNTPEQRMRSKQTSRKDVKSGPILQDLALDRRTFAMLAAQEMMNCAWTGEHVLIVRMADSGLDRRRTRGGDQGPLAGQHLRHGAAHTHHALGEVLAREEILKLCQEYGGGEERDPSFTSRHQHSRRRSAPQEAGRVAPATAREQLRMDAQTIRLRSDRR